ncbi:MAG: trehalose-6-phosphate synthase [Deltaproteobacteria bacterium]|nr:trehalose-6-phosphate synthase [Deltaproteobacteria bacterium]MBW2419850.1 trehalose-6-phosphate synthase [Deltaproteobacteria bacterium]
MVQDLRGSEGPLLVVSNRLPFVFQRGDTGLTRRPSPGGLVTALDPVLRKRGGTWLGWPGGDIGIEDALELRGDQYRVAPVILSESEITRYYHGFSNRTLWPLFHSLPARTGFDERDWEAYQRVNLRFANAALEELDAANWVWIHDYQLMLVPEFVRREMSGGRLGFFLHVPFPCYDIYRALPWQSELLRGLLACDLVGFQVESYMRNFMECAERILGARVDREYGVIEYAGHRTRVGSFPIGIDREYFETRAEASPPARSPRRERILFGADRLDYTKGIPERIRAVERLLDLHPEYREKVVLLQIAVPSRSQVAEYRALKREIDELVGRVNGRFATPSWSPIRYIYQSLSHDRLARFYRDADVALVTPLRDGMNLVAKEFVACQVGDPGVLVLSTLAGAAESMEEALLVNPHDVQGTADAIHRALCMPRDERAERMNSLRARERSNDVHAWVNGFLARLG